MNERIMLRANIAAILPARMATRPIDHRGYPVPWFVTLREPETGRWDFRVLDPARYIEAIRKRFCWICGHRLGKHLSFVIGPMCGMSRISAEPPQHLDCAEFAVKTCPFMLLPKAQRRDAGLPEVATHDKHLLHNPEVMLIWTTDNCHPFIDEGVPLFKMGPAESISAWKGGKPATRAEIDAAVSKGLAALIAKFGGEQAIPDNELQELAERRLKFETLLPSA